jgi:hypothetical protein
VAVLFATAIIVELVLLGTNPLHKAGRKRCTKQFSYLVLRLWCLWFSSPRTSCGVRDRSHPIIIPLSALRPGALAAAAW